MKKIELDLSKDDGTSIQMLDAFERQARHEAWTGLEISNILDDASSFDYEHLVKTLTFCCRSN